MISRSALAKGICGEFKAKVFSVVRRYGGQDFAVVVDAKGRTHHKHFSELRLLQWVATILSRTAWIARPRCCGGAPR
ncbi:hypothetical protein I6F35_35470 [Bradyrhizobium sp. BRP22]|uniref:hypothetical protein n=1 Tax=Bradyrhizobium sp. BRP22 TaxID=2793821 RepID=UPI001CD5D6FD|nr:hypothetical protein [Bradyrhizobium sp. BRP22]MCA1458414.1 hypothetical protein [Bradyrhizobium sp. BRP22]